MEETPHLDAADDDQDFARSEGSISLPTASSRKRPADVSDDAAARQARKRAPTACHTCKSRKVKCSNDRPRCTGCVRLGCECIYPEQNYRVSADPATPMVLRALDEILERLPPRSEGLGVSSLENRGPTDDWFPHRIPLRTFGSLPDATLTSDGGPLPQPRKPPTASDEPSEHVALDSVFRWPIFADSSARKWSRHILFVADQESGSSGMLTNVQGAARLPSLNDFDDIIVLVHQFLRHVHIKNPVLDSKTLLRDARVVAETGPMWDTRSCLVLVAAALGAIAAPFDSTTTPKGTSIETSSRDHEARTRAETYFHAARRRFGLLDRSIAACQCHFLSGIYLMYTMHPIPAWQSFIGASTAYIVYLKSHGRFSTEGNQWNDTQKPALKSLEQRLYWSCLKSENELVTELPLPPSGLSSINYPHMFPSLPADFLNAPLPNGFASFSNGTLMDASPQSTSTTSSDPVDQALLQEQSWFYYLTEISLLRLSDRIIQYFYTAENASWLRTNVLDMINTADEFERQLDGWRDSLPLPIRFWDSRLLPDKYSELHIATWGRYVKLKRLLYRPFLYRFVHPQASDVLLRDVVQSYAEKCVHTCIDPIFEVGVSHRHHGSWFRCREAVLSTLILLAAGRVGLTRIMNLEIEAGYFVRLNMDNLRYWEGESPDIALSRKIIEMMCTEYGMLEPSPC
ncbi:hypothetical protein AK830_g9248 [Neonectria ditissima]|uniref:Zn(2)-C6 fungal-type domain-containing protein n=1 Tax=Neonectria ditissima TaxID=78410 RepID=A0A0P7AVC4_9HYPO|nr:hypothetical protein AK830_g9248 [Neonectria ditissima]